MGGAPKYFAMPQVKAMDLTSLMHLEVAAKPIGGRPVSAQSTESRYSKGPMAQVGRICEGCPSIEAWTAAAARRTVDAHHGENVLVSEMFVMSSS